MGFLLAQVQSVHCQDEQLVRGRAILRAAYEELQHHRPRGLLQDGLWPLEQEEGAQDGALNLSAGRRHRLGALRLSHQQGHPHPSSRRIRTWKVRKVS